MNSLQKNFLGWYLRSQFRRNFSNYYCCILTVPTTTPVFRQSLPFTAAVVLACHDTLTRRKELAVKPNLDC